ncbi:hypothetical protein FRX31_015728 [Thalictrum thalictroides]|uniref:Uncharacterized protein n=1 Tax=Thalictrum thalictroides TaxID=46969 RepID=A0A7J6WB73_THATH|nr:hypothetical protein FRX31_015728 [Thalictrum thalictroides]
MASQGQEVPMINTSDYDRQKELKLFDETKAGVKGLVDQGVTKIPRIFITPSDGKVSITKPVSHDVHLEIPVIDFKGIDDKDLNASEELLLHHLCINRNQVNQMVYYVIRVKIMFPEYSTHDGSGLRTKLLELISEALGLDPYQLQSMDGAEDLSVAGNFLPSYI